MGKEKQTMEKNFCFHARVGSDRYRLALLALYPQLLQLREIVKRLAVIRLAIKRPEMSDGNATMVVNTTVTEENNEGIKLLRELESQFETTWTITLEAAGVLSNSFAPYPAENCNNAVSKDYSNLWSRCDTLFFKSLETLKQCFVDCFQQLQKFAVNQAVEERINNCIEQQPIDIRQLFRETRQLEASDTRLKQTLIQSIALETRDQPTVELHFPVSTSRLLL